MPGSLGKKVNYEFHPDGYIISTAGPGVEIDLEDALQLFEAARSRYQAPFGLISNRIHEYSIAFSVYEYLEAADDIVAMAVVLYDRAGFPAAKLETRYLKRTAYATFFDLDRAQEWMRERLAEAAQPPSA